MRPNLQVVYMSGHADDVLNERGVSRKEVTLHPMRRGRPDRKKRLAATAMEAPLREWLKSSEGQGALAMWAVWEGKLLEDAS